MRLAYLYPQPLGLTYTQVRQGEDYLRETLAVLRHAGLPPPVLYRFHETSWAPACLTRPNSGIPAPVPQPVWRHVSHLLKGRHVVVDARPLGCHVPQDTLRLFVTFGFKWLEDGVSLLTGGPHGSSALAAVQAAQALFAGTFRQYSPPMAYATPHLLARYGGLKS